MVSVWKVSLTNGYNNHKLFFTLTYPSSLTPLQTVTITIMVQILLMLIILMLHPFLFECLKLVQINI